MYVTYIRLQERILSRAWPVAAASRRSIGESPPRHASMSTASSPPPTTEDCTSVQVHTTTLAEAGARRSASMPDPQDARLGGIFLLVVLRAILSCVGLGPVWRHLPPPP